MSESNKPNINPDKIFSLYDQRLLSCMIALIVQLCSVFAVHRVAVLFPAHLPSRAELPSPSGKRW